MVRLFQRLDRFLVSSSSGRSLFGPMVSTSLTLFLLVLIATWYGVRRSELERAASEARSSDFEDRLRHLVLTTRNESVEAAERAKEAAVGALRSSLYGLEAQAASSDVAAAATARAYLALFDR